MRNNNLRYADDTTLMAESEEELKNLLMRVKEESEKAGLKLNIKNIKIMPSITSRQIEGEKVETVTDFLLLGSKIIVDYDCRHEIKRCLFLERKALASLESILKNIDITQPFLWSNSHIYTWWLEKNHNFDYTELCRQSDIYVF